MATKKVDHSMMKLGKHPVRHDPRTLHLKDYIDINKLPKAPAEHVWAKQIPNHRWGLMMNKKIENCTVASAAHLIIEWTADNGKPVVPTDDTILKAYSAITGYNPVTGAHDDGANQLDVLHHWRKKGIAGHKVMAYVKLNHKDRNHIKQACFLFGGCYAGFLLPKTAWKQKKWRLTSLGLKGRGKVGSWGGHAVAIIGYDRNGVTCVTWGETKKITWAFWDAYCEEAYAVISPDFASKKGSPSGFNLDILKKDLKKVK
ncbi:MAG TPA: hypothetical protein VK808_08395 [Bacteroidia bacterium]|jgi:hypothetical protein|nr:hypothetical protein [Bacteroidia bacterium]